MAQEWTGDAPLVGDLLPQDLVVLDEGALLLEELLKVLLERAQDALALLLGEVVVVDDGAEDLDEALRGRPGEVVEGEVFEAARAGELLAVGGRRGGRGSAGWCLTEGEAREGEGDGQGDLEDPDVHGIAVDVLQGRRGSDVSERNDAPRRARLSEGDEEARGRSSSRGGRAGRAAGLRRGGRLLHRVRGCGPSTTRRWPGCGPGSGGRGRRG